MSDPGASSRPPLRVAVIGSGPGGFFAAISLLKQTAVPVAVDVFDRLPTPFGLVRGGVAPDHQKVKAVVRTFEQAAADPRFRFFGNVDVGHAVPVDALRRHYDAVVYAVGNEADRPLGIPGQDLDGVTPATVFVGWYNGHPDYRDAQFDLTSRTVAVVGNGNVAVDVVRILARTADELATTDIADEALEALRHSRVEEILMLGRRGPVQAAFTPQELAELAALPHADLVVDPQEIELDPESRADLEASPPKSAMRRNYEILTTAARQPSQKGGRRIRMRFCVSPVELTGDARGRVRRMRLERNLLQRDESGTLRPRGSGVFEDLDVDWVFVSIGYQGRPIPGIPFDARTSRVANRDGRVLDPETGAVRPGEYVVGWAQSGPKGLIGMHKKASAAVVETLLADVREGKLPSSDAPGRQDVTDLLERLGVEFVTYEDWKRIDAAEIERGRARGAPRVKFTRVEEMLAAAHPHRARS